MFYPYKIKNQKPRLYWLVRVFFPDYNFDRGHVFTFYRTIYTKSAMSEALLAHELRHIEQQGSSLVYSIVHSICYRLSADFRYQSELEGYRAEYQAIKYQRDPDFANRYAKGLVTTLLQPLYGFENTEENFYKIIKDLKA